MKKTFVGVIMLLLFFPLVTANLYITEVMHSPTQVSDSEGEWIEIYNDADQNIDLNSWTLDGKVIANSSITAKSYLILARELIDSTDLDTESFEFYWGNNNLLWDENFSAREVSMSLKEEDTIVLTNGINTETVSYNKSLGGKEGKTIERMSLTEWQQGPVDGTPGLSNFSTQQNSGNEIYLFVDILNNIPEILRINLTDDLAQEGIQILPLLEGERIVQVEVLVNDSDGFADIQEVSYIWNNETKNLSFERNLSATTGLYSANLALSSSLLAGKYTLNVFARDTENTVELNQSFSYEGMLRTELNRTSFQMALHSGELSEQVVQIYNRGNVLVDTEVSADDLTTTSQRIEKKNVEIFDGVWLPLANPVFVDANILPQDAKEIKFRLRVPQNAISGKYQGKITITSMESKNAE